jgi:hypothetical protein
VLGRPPGTAERSAALKFVETLPESDAVKTGDHWAQLIQSLFATLDFRYLK